MKHVALGLLILGLAVFAPRIFELGLLHDDWPYFYDVANGSDSIASPGGLRPLHGVSWKLCGMLFGTSLPGYYAVLFALQWLTACLFYVVARRYLAEGLAIAFAALTMIYPGDASHLWLASMPQRSAWLLALAAVALAEHQRSRNTNLGPDLGVAAAAMLGLVSLLIYELHFFLLAAWPLLLALTPDPSPSHTPHPPRERGATTRPSRAGWIGWRRRHLALWTAAPALYLVWRFAIHPLTGGATIVNTEWLLDPLAIARRALVLVPYNLFGDGWWIGIEAIPATPIAALAFFGAALAACLVIFRRAIDRPGRRTWLVAGTLIVLGAAPVIPTTYWLGRTAGTFAGRVLAGALPGAALLLVLAVAVALRTPRWRAGALAALMTVAAAFHWNVAGLAADHWGIQQRLTQAVRNSALDWPTQSFAVVLDLPPNRLGYDTPWGVGRLIREARDDETLSGLGLGADRSPAEVLAVRDGKLLVHGGAFANVPTSRVRIVRWRDGRLIPDSLENLKLP